MSDEPPTRFDPKTAQELAALLADLSHDKETRSVVGRAIRKKFPDTQHARAFPDLDLEDKFEAEREKDRKARLEEQQQDLIRHMNAQRARLLDGGPDGAGPKYDEDTVKKIEALMEKKGITDYEDGRTLFAATQPPIERPTPRPQHNGATWEIPMFDKYAKDPSRAARERAYEVIDELNRKRA
jgi:hypothetical protein